MTANDLGLMCIQPCFVNPHFLALQSASSKTSSQYLAARIIRGANMSSEGSQTSPDNPQHGIIPLPDDVVFSDKESGSSVPPNHPANLKYRSAVNFFARRASSSTQPPRQELVVNAIQGTVEGRFLLEGSDGVVVELDSWAAQLRIARSVILMTEWQSQYASAATALQFDPTGDPIDRRIGNHKSNEKYVALPLPTMEEYLGYQSEQIASIVEEMVEGLKTKGGRFLVACRDGVFREETSQEVKRQVLDDLERGRKIIYSSSSQPASMPSLEKRRLVDWLGNDTVGNATDIGAKRPQSRAQGEDGVQVRQSKRQRTSSLRIQEEDSTTTPTKKNDYNTTTTHQEVPAAASTNVPMINQEQEQASLKRALWDAQQKVQAQKGEIEKLKEVLRCTCDLNLSMGQERAEEVNTLKQALFEAQKLNKEMGQKRDQEVGSLKQTLCDSFALNKRIMKANQVSAQQIQQFKRAASAKDQAIQSFAHQLRKSEQARETAVGRLGAQIRLRDQRLAKFQNDDLCSAPQTPSSCQNAWQELDAFLQENSASNDSSEVEHTNALSHRGGS